jgi:hypothetical protein
MDGTKAKAKGQADGRSTGMDNRPCTVPWSILNMAAVTSLNCSGRSPYSRSVPFVTSKLTRLRCRVERGQADGPMVELLDQPTHWIHRHRASTMIDLT